jgi:hypothetical protein
MPTFAGNVASTAATASVCSTSRGAAPRPRMSSITPTSASASAATLSTANWVAPARPDTATPIHRPTSAAATTAMPPPCGVGSRCEERAFGRAKA